MPQKKIQCPTCDGPMSVGAEQCRRCKPSYQRTPEHRQAMSAALSGKPKPHMQGKKRPAHSKLMREWWTPERRESKRLDMLERNPMARYHGLSADGAREIRKAAGQCQKCQSRRNLDVHHLNGDKRDQTLSNLVVLCHQCHMRLHSDQGDLKR